MFPVILEHRAGSWHAVINIDWPSRESKKKAASELQPQAGAQVLNGKKEIRPNWIDSFGSVLRHSMRKVCVLWFRENSKQMQKREGIQHHDQVQIRLPQ